MIKKIFFAAIAVLGSLTVNAQETVKVPLINGIATYSDSVPLLLKSNNVVVGTIDSYNNVDQAFEIKAFDGDSIPSNTGIMIQGDADYAEFEVLSKEPKRAYSNLLQPTVEALTIRNIPADRVYLYVEDGKWKTLQRRGTVQAHSCYMSIPASYYNELVTIPVNLSSGIKIYSSAKPLQLYETSNPNIIIGTITSIERGKGFRLTKFQDGYIPSNTGFVIYGKQGDVVSFRESSYEPENYYSSLLVANVEAKEVYASDMDEGNTLILISNGKTFEMTSGSKNLPANFAYLVVPKKMWQTTNQAKSGAPLFSYDLNEDETTEISSAKVTETTSDNGFYTIEGKKIDMPQKGMYIHNGKKYILK